MAASVSPSPFPFPVFVINLARSTERWRLVSARAAAIGLPLIRIGAVDGDAIPADERSELDLRRFRLCHGRSPLPGEYGCYLSHLAALDAVLANGAANAVILEDDAWLPDAFAARVLAVVASSLPFDLVKLHNHRVSGFIRRATTAEGDALGRCLHGPLGSTAGYLVSRAGAARLRQTLTPMTLPYDIALERGWRHGLRIYACRPSLVQLAPVHHQSDIVDPSDPARSYAGSKLPLPLRTPTAIFRGIEYLRRAAYAVEPDTHLLRMTPRRFRATLGKGFDEDDHAR